MTALARGVSFTLHPHPNADRLSIAKIDGTDWQCVTATDQWNPSERVGVYVAIDALVDPARPEFEFLKDKATKTFADGRPAHRIKTVRLRGVLSQGLLIPVPACAIGNAIHATHHEPDYEALLGIERYEPPIPAELRGDMVREPGAFARYTKIENAKNFPHVFAEGEPVRVTEKIHGTNFRVGLVDAGGVTLGGLPCLDYCVGTHATARDPNGANLYSRMAKRFLPEDKLRDVACRVVNPKSQLVVFAEIYGSKVQDLQYGCPPGEQRVRIFDVLCDGDFLDFETVADIAAALELDTVPLLYRGPYVAAAITALRDGKTTLPGATNVREGVVVTAEPETRVPYNADAPHGAFEGRKILKFINDAYLERSGAKDGH